MSNNAFYPLTVSHLQATTRDALVLQLAVPPELQSVFNFQAGQYLTLRATVNGEDVRRAYSICSAQGGALRVGIKRVADGAFSNWVHQQVTVGSVLQVMPPLGRFGKAVQALAMPEPASGRAAAANLGADPSRMPHNTPPRRKRYLGIAAGSGITPVLSIAQTLLQSQHPAHAGCHFTLIYGNRSTPSVMFKDEWAALKDRFPQRLSLIYVMSREPQDMDLFHGRIDRDKCDTLLRNWLRVDGPVNALDEAWICGPTAMMDACSASLQAAGMGAEQIHTERFASTPAGAASKPKRAVLKPTGTDAALCEVSLTMDGATRQFSMRRGDQSVLDAGLAAGLDMRYSCKGGVCSTCRAKVIEGEVEMDVNYALEDYEVRRGFVLTCQAYCQSPRLVLSFDEET